MRGGIEPCPGEKQERPLRGCLSQASMMGKSQEAQGQGAKGEGSCCASRTAPSASLLAALLLSLVSVAACVYLGMKTSDLQARVLAIETAQGGLSAAAATAASYPLLPSYSLDHLNSLMQEKVERLLAQVWWPWKLRMGLGHPRKRCE